MKIIAGARRGYSTSETTAINQILAVAPSKLEVLLLEKDTWPVTGPPPKQLCSKDRDCVDTANKNLLKAVEMGKQIYKKAHVNHISCLKIVKQGAATLSTYPKGMAKAEADLKKSRADAAAMPNYNILETKKGYSDEKIQSLMKLQKKSDMVIKKLKKKAEDLEKKLKKTKSVEIALSTDDTVEAH